MSNLNRNSKKIRIAFVLLPLSLLVTSVLISPAGAGPFMPPIFGSPGTFAGSTAANWVLPSNTPNNHACLTAALPSGSPIPGCTSPSQDVSGSGVLRLTSNANSQVGGVWNSYTWDLQSPLDIAFTTYQYHTSNGFPADGIGFGLAVADPANPSPPTVTGGLGGSLGYIGLPNAYMGVGFDVYGNFQPSGCTEQGVVRPTPVYQNALLTQGNSGVTVLGSGTQNAAGNYCTIGTQNGFVLDAASSSDRASAGVPAEVTLNPTSQYVTSSKTGVSVRPMGWAVTFLPVGASSWVTETGYLPSTNSASPGYDPALTQFPSNLINAATGLPKALSFGFFAGTGSGNEIHEVDVKYYSGVTTSSQSIVASSQSIVVEPKVVASTTPDAPTNLSVATPRSGGIITLTWSPVADNGSGPITSYVCSSGAAVTISVTGTSCTFTNKSLIITNNSASLSVVAVNQSGTSDPATLPVQWASPPTTTTTTTTPVITTKTITCHKGIHLKKVTGVTPVCPSGWKQ